MWWAWALWGCTAPQPTLVVAPDAARSGEEGTDGPLGAARLSLRVQARVTEAVPTVVVFPADADGEPVRPDGAWPVVSLVHGGLVPEDRYEWLARHFATRGYAVVLPEHPLDLAIFASDNAAATLRGLRDRPPAALGDDFGDDTPAAVMGHSLGGVVATKAWLEAPELYDGLALLASWPAAGDDVSARAGDPVLSLVGSEDGSADPAEAEAGAARFADPVYFGVIDGLNHYGWTDGETAAEVEKEASPRTRPLADCRQDGLRVLDTALDAWLKADPDAAARLDAGRFPGVEGAW